MIRLVLEYVWLDGNAVKNLRSKIKVMNVEEFRGFEPEHYPDWGFDGSSTNQAPGNKSDVILKPVRVIENPLYRPNASSGDMSLIVLCDVANPNGKPHETSTRAGLVELAEKYESHKMWFAFEQEYTIYDGEGTAPYRWPISGFPSPQGKYYCGVGDDVAWGRDISNDHLEACLWADMSIVGTNAEVMPSQWEFQTGPLEALDAADNLWLARFLLNRVGEQHGCTIKLDPKPIKGDWNGAGCHTNFSTRQMRNKCPEEHWTAICEAIGERVDEHLKVYGHQNHERLTGEHETCSIEEYRFGESDRGASIRVPPAIVKEGKGYLEDRRPAANIDPYLVCGVLLETVCGAYARGEVDGSVVQATS